MRDWVREKILGPLLKPFWRTWETLWSILIYARLGGGKEAASPQLTFESDEWKRQHDECSGTIRRLLLTIIGFSVFCVVTLGKPDVDLLGVGTPIKLPFAGVDVTFLSFLFAGPVFLMVLFTYLHIFVGYWLALNRVSEQSRLPFLFNLDIAFAKHVSYLVFYWLVPGVLFGFVWKALPQPSAPFLVFFACTGTVVSVLLQIRRHPEFRWWEKLCRWTFLGLLLFFAPNIVKEGPRIRPLQLFKAQLQEKDLRGFQMRYAYLVEANLGKANLLEADLREANLSRASLHGANLSRAENLTREQIKEALPNEATKLLDDLTEQAEPSAEP